MSTYVRAEVASTANSLGRTHDGEYVIDENCFESLKDLIRFLLRDDEYHEVRRYLGESRLLQSDLVQIAIITSSSNVEVFDMTVRLLVNLLHPMVLLYKEETPKEKVGRNLYISLSGYLQDYKMTFCSVNIWVAICGRLADLFQIDWTERSEDEGLQIERILLLLRNVLQVPSDSHVENRPDNDISMHDEVLWAMRQSQLMELLLYVSSQRDGEQYYLYLVEIFSLVLREQNPRLLATCEVRRSVEEKTQDVNVLIELREREKRTRRELKSLRTFQPTYVVKNFKSITDQDLIFHKSIDKLSDLQLTQDKARKKTPKNRIPGESERIVRHSTFSVRLFLKEFCIEFLSSSFNTIMRVIKDKLTTGKALANDESYYFWALYFFLEFNCAYHKDVKLVNECINVQAFHFAQTQIERCYEHLITEKKAIAAWVKRLHLILKGYHTLLRTLQWMDEKNDLKDKSRIIKSNIFYVVEYRELILTCLLKYDRAYFSLSFLRDLIETVHTFTKILEDHCKSTRLVVQKVTKAKKLGNETKQKKIVLTWEAVQEDLLSVLVEGNIPEVPPFDASLDLSPDKEKERCMGLISKSLHRREAVNAIALLRSAREVWPENNWFGFNGMGIDEEVASLEEIWKAKLYVETSSEEEDEDDTAGQPQISEVGFEFREYIQRLANKRVVEACTLLLANYKKNTAFTNHCVAKLLHRVGWECHMPAMLYQAGIFLTFKELFQENDPRFKELHKLAIHIMRKFRINAATNPRIFMELLFFKDPKTAFDIEEGYGKYQETKSTKAWSEEEENELRRLWEENPDLQWVMENKLEREVTRSMRAVKKRLKEMGMVCLSKKDLAEEMKFARGKWTEEEIAELREFYEMTKDGFNVPKLISDRLKVKRSIKAVREKLKELGLVKSRFRDRSVSSERESSERSVSPEERRQYTIQEEENALEGVKEMKPALQWLLETIEECLEDSETAAYPLLAMDEVQCDALENDAFLSFLYVWGLEPPAEDQVYWKLSRKNLAGLNRQVEMLKRMLNPPKTSEVTGTVARKIGSESSSDEEQRCVMRKKKQPRTMLVSSDSDENECVEKNQKMRFGCIASDSDGDVNERITPSRPKRRRCIGSDSEIEDQNLSNGSDEERFRRPMKYGKMSKTIGSDSDFDGYDYSK